MLPAVPWPGLEEWNGGWGCYSPPFLVEGDATCDWSRRTDAVPCPMELPGLRKPYPRPEEARVSPGGVPLEGSRGCSRSATCPSQLLSTLVRPRNLDHDTWWILPRKFPRAPLWCPVGLSKKKPGAHPGGQPTSTHPDLQRKGIDRGKQGNPRRGWMMASSIGV